MLTAEVIPIGEKNAVAMALQREGFEIISIREIITIGGELEIFEKFFKMKMERFTINVLPEISSLTDVEFYKPVTPPIIPDKYKFFIKDILFLEPPEFF